MSTDTDPRAARTARGWRGSRFLIVACTLLVCTALAGEAFAQLSTGRARVRGRVEDPQGNPVAGAEITLTHGPTGDVVEAETNEAGIWVKGNLGPGRWEVQTRAPGFATVTQPVTLRDLDRNWTIDTYLKPGSDEGDAGAPGASNLFEGELGDKIEAANALFDAGDHAAALASYEAILAEEEAQEEPVADIHLLHLSLGNAAFELDEYERSAEHYAAVLEKSPDNQDARLGLAKAYMMDRRLDEAVAELDKLDQASIEDPVVFYNIGSLLFDQGQSADAEVYYREAVRLDPAFGEAHMQLALALIQQGKMAEARPHLEQVIELEPESENAALAEEFLAMIEG